MTPLNVATHEHEANDLRLGEIHRVEDVVVANMKMYGHLTSVAFVAGLSWVSASLRPLFSWNPDD